MKRVLASATVLTVAAVLVFAVFATPPASVRAQTNPAGAPWSCSLDGVDNTLTLCEPAHPDQRLFITQVVAQSTTTTGGQFILRYGTGTACGTGTASLFPAAATAVRIAAPANTAAATVINFNPPLSLAPAKQLCVLGVATNTVTITISGYVQQQ